MASAVVSTAITLIIRGAPPPPPPALPGML